MGYLIILVSGFGILPFISAYGTYIPHTEWKWVAVYGAVAGSLLLLTLNKDAWNLPKIPNYMLWILATMLTVLSLNYFYHDLPFFSGLTTDRIGFCALTLAAYFYFKAPENKTKLIFLLIPLFLSTFVLISLGFYFHFVPFSMGLPGTFVNINMATQFVLLSLSVQLAFLTKESPYFDRWVAKILIGLSVYSLTYLYFGSSRSALIGVGIIFVFLISWKKLSLKRALTIIALSTLSITTLEIFTDLSTQLTKKQPVDKDVRMKMYINTVDMIKKHPLGVGVQQYEFAFIPYMGKIFPTFHERLFLHSPHSFPLRILTEDGVIYGGLLALFLSFFLWHFRQNLFINPNFQTLVCVSFFVALIPEILFQFPFENSFPFFASSFFLGLLLASCVKETVSIPQGLQKTVQWAVIPFFFVMTLSTAISLPLAFQGQWDESKAHLACQLNPAYWKGCVNEARTAAKNGKLGSAKIKLQKILERTPLNFFALMNISDFALREGGENHNWGCHGFWLYDQLFQGQSSLHLPLTKYCSPQLIQSFEKEGFEPGYRRFLNHIGIDRGPFPTLKDFGKRLGF